MKNPLLTFTFTSLQEALSKDSVRNLIKDYHENPTSNNRDRLIWSLIYNCESLPVDNLKIDLQVSPKKWSKAVDLKKLTSKNLDKISGVSLSEILKFQDRIIKMREKLRGDHSRFVVKIDFKSDSRDRSAIISAYKKLCNIYAEMGVTELSRNKNSFLDMMIEYCMPPKDRPFNYNVFSDHKLAEALQYLKTEYDKLHDPHSNLTKGLIEYYLTTRDKDYDFSRNLAYSSRYYVKFMMCIEMIDKTLKEFKNMDQDTQYRYIKLWVDTQMHALDSSDLPDNLETETGFLCREASAERFHEAIRGALKTAQKDTPSPRRFIIS